MASTTFTARGHRVRTQSHFRFQIVSVEAEGATIVGRSDSLASATKRAGEFRVRDGRVTVVIDRETGEELRSFPKQATSTTSTEEATMATSKPKATSKAKATPKAKKAKKPTAADRGVPAAYLGETGNFRTGMDARFKSDLINTILETPNEKALATFTPQEAKKLLAAFGWNGHLVKSRESRERKAAAKARAAEARAEAKAEAEAARAKAKEEKAS